MFRLSLRLQGFVLHPTRCARRRPPLAVERLEDRRTPAVVSFNAGTGTLIYAASCAEANAVRIELVNGDLQISDPGSKLMILGQGTDQLGFTLGGGDILSGGDYSQIDTVNVQLGDMNDTA